MDRRFFLLAGEASGDRLGADLMAGLRSFERHPQFLGVGGPAMESAGLQSLFCYRELSVMGISEVLPRLPKLLALARRTAAHVVASDVAALITIDSPEFSFRVARAVRKARPDLPIIHYVSPSIWAWRPWRVNKLKGIVDHVLAILPFEPDLLRAAGVGSTFVGHPAVFAAAATPQETKDLRHSLGINAETPILAVLPGSRASEVRRLAPVFGAAVELFLERNSEFRVVVPAAKSVTGLVRQETGKWPTPPVVIDSDEFTGPESDRRKLALFSTSDIALAASGSVTLELAAADTPMVVAYDVRWLSRQLIGALLRVETVTLVNLVFGKNAVPELLGKDCRADGIFRALDALCHDSGKREFQAEAARETTRKLRSQKQPPGIVAAETVLGVIRSRQGPTAQNR